LTPPIQAPDVFIAFYEKNFITKTPNLESTKFVLYLGFKDGLAVIGVGRTDDENADCAHDPNANVSYNSCFLYFPALRVAKKSRAAALGENRRMEADHFAVQVQNYFRSRSG
jgi:hypothetical protein